MVVKQCLLIKHLTNVKSMKSLMFWGRVNVGMMMSAKVVENVVLEINALGMINVIHWLLKRVV